jgi:hypothetical protein
MKRSASLSAALLLGLLAAFLVAAGQATDPGPPIQVGHRYVFLFPSEAKRTAEVVEELGDGWLKVKYLHSDGVERLIFMNLDQVVYFHPADDDPPRPIEPQRRGADTEETS